MTIQGIRSGLFVFGDGCIRVDRLRTNNQELIINNPSKQVQPVSFAQCNGAGLNNWSHCRV